VTRAPRRAKQEIAQREEQIVALRLRHSPFCGDRAHPSGSTRVTPSGAFNKALRRNTDQDIQTHHWSELAELDAQQARLRTIGQSSRRRQQERACLLVLDFGSIMLIVVYMCYKRILLFILGLSLSGCVTQESVNRKAATMAYPDAVAAAAADKKECAQGDQEQCLKLQRAGDRCREMIARGDTSASGLLCQHFVDGGDISQR
jgi:hypothetical protein